MLPKPGLLRWEIGIALLIKIILLIGLWFLLFRWHGKPQQPDISGLFSAPAVTRDYSSQPVKESSNVR